MSFHILGLGTAVPVYSVSQSTAMEVAKQFSTQTDEQRRLLPVLYRRAGVKRRHSVLLEPGGEPDFTASESGKGTRAGQQGSEIPAAVVLTSASPLAEENLTQSFYPPAESELDGGPSTSARMEQYARHAGDLAARAAVEALEHGGIAAARVTHLVTVSCTGFQAPGVDLELIRELGLPAQTARTHVGFMGCHGALNGLRIARAFGDSEPNACVLMVAVELCSLHHQYGWLPDRIVANALFADGAAAIVGSSRDLRPAPPSHEAPATWQVIGNGSFVLPDSEDAMSWRIGDHGFDMTLSSSVPDMIRQSLKAWVSEWLNSHDLNLEDVGSWAIHPGGPRILSACAEALDLSSRQLAPSRDILSRFGNMSSPTVLFILKELLGAHARLPCVALAFGPGLTIEALLVGGGAKGGGPE